MFPLTWEAKRLIFFFFFFIAAYKEKKKSHTILLKRLNLDRSVHFPEKPEQIFHWKPKPLAHTENEIFKKIATRKSNTSSQTGPNQTHGKKKKKKSDKTPKTKNPVLNHSVGFPDLAYGTQKHALTNNQLHKRLLNEQWCRHFTPAPECPHCLMSSLMHRWPHHY